MFNSLFANLLSWIATGLDNVMTWIMQMMSFNLDFFTQNFPVIGDLYEILQGVGIAFVVAIASVQLFKYFTGPISEVTTNPIEILVRATLSFTLIFWGNYIIEFVVNLFSYPYQALMDVSVDGSGLSTMTDSSNSLSGLISGAAGVLVALILLVAVGWNVIKLLLEIVERFLMVGVLTYTSPLIWPTLTSKGSQPIFSKWMSMFLGQCMLMILNVWSIKMIVSILGYGAANVFFRFVITLAFCKVAQRFDTYLNSLGINAAHTGGSLLDDIVATGSTISGFGSKAAGAVASATGHTALGENLSKRGWIGTAATAVGNGMQSNAAQKGIKSIHNTPIGQESDIVQSATGRGFDWKDAEGNLWTAQNKGQMETLQSIARQGYSKYEGESGISQNHKGQFSWTDKDGKVHKASSAAGILTDMQETRAAYKDAVLKGSQPDNSTGTDLSPKRGGNQSPTGNLSGMNQSAFASRLFHANGIPKNGATTMDASGREILTGSTPEALAKTIANASTPEAMKTGAGRDTASEIKAATITSTGAGTARALMNSNVPGGIQDDRVNAAVFDQLYGGGEIASPKNGIESVIPGLSQAVAASSGELTDGSGEVEDLKLNNGEMTGSYIPSDTNGDGEDKQQFSIRTQESYNGLTPEEQSGYTEFKGVDGASYYAKSTTAQLSGISQPESDSNSETAYSSSAAPVVHTEAPAAVISEEPELRTSESVQIDHSGAVSAVDSTEAQSEQGTVHVAEEATAPVTVSHDDQPDYSAGTAQVVHTDSARAAISSYDMTGGDSCYVSRNKRDINRAGTADISIVNGHTSTTGANPVTVQDTRGSGSKRHRKKRK